MAKKLSVSEKTYPTITIDQAFAMAGSVPALAQLLDVSVRTCFHWRKTHNGNLPHERYEQMYGLVQLGRWKPVNGEVLPKMK